MSSAVSTLWILSALAFVSLGDSPPEKNAGGLGAVHARISSPAFVLSLPESARHGFVLLKRLDVAPGIDGDLSDWPARVPAPVHPR